MNKIYNCDCVEGLKNLEPDCIDLVVTSPPYDNLRSYNGYSFDFEAVAKQLLRVVKSGGIVVWIANDQTINGDETGSCFRQALFFKEIGFKLRDTMIWVKDGGGAVGSNTHYAQNFEYMFVLSKGNAKTTNIIKDKINKSYGQDKSGSGRRRKNGEIRKEQRKPPEQFSRRNNWWYIPPQRYSGHPAVFPLQLAKDHIISWSNEGDVVLDPFIGSGTTAVAAIETGRNFIGFEISKEYCEIAEKRIAETKYQYKLF